jgi:hypothetical protein
MIQFIMPIFDAEIGQHQPLKVDYGHIPAINIVGQARQNARLTMSFGQVPFGAASYNINQSLLRKKKKK